MRACRSRPIILTASSAGAVAPCRTGPRLGRSTRGALHGLPQFIPPSGVPSARPFRLISQALAHAAVSQVQRAYQRSDLCRAAPRAPWRSGRLLHDAAGRKRDRPAVRQGGIMTNKHSAFSCATPSAPTPSPSTPGLRAYERACLSESFRRRPDFEAEASQLGRAGASPAGGHLGSCLPFYRHVIERHGDRGCRLGSTSRLPATTPFACATRARASAYFSPPSGRAHRRANDTSLCLPAALRRRPNRLSARDHGRRALLACAARSSETADAARTRGGDPPPAAAGVKGGPPAPA